MSKNREADKINSSIKKRILENTLGKSSEHYFIHTIGVIIITALLIPLAFLVLDWTSGIRPSPAQPEISISVTRSDRNLVSVMILSIGHKETVIKHLSYNTSQGTGFINRTDSPFEFVRDVGDYGVIPLSGYNEYLEITAVLGNTTTRMYSGKI
ncbi:MAG: hypothetical protein O8C66_13165 [Candidatus Methanoperedens sp.]|nr:hypothetical protein [Candidatus Methanoperedens sp.]MCZ7371447.1 hypothetical protein [Candidatus Methanoperedens sp.]